MKDDTMLTLEQIEELEKKSAEIRNFTNRKKTA